MIGRLNHVAIAVKDLDRSTALYRDTLGARVSAPLPQPDPAKTSIAASVPKHKLRLNMMPYPSPVSKRDGRTRVARRPPVRSCRSKVSRCRYVVVAATQQLVEPVINRLLNEVDRPVPEGEVGAGRVV